MQRYTSKIVLTALIVTGAITAKCQATEPVPYFSAVIVTNMDSSVVWYQSVFGLKVKNQMNDGGNKVVILESGRMLLELLELKGSLTQKEILKGKSAETKIQGHFKIGFKVGDLDGFIKHLSRINIPVNQVWGNATSKTRNFLIYDPGGNLIQFFE
jgi:hypothetical protein